MHHWQAAGLIPPPTRSGAGYRLYTSTDIARMRRIKLYRDLGVRLADIGALLNGRAADRDAELRRRHEELMERIAELRLLRRPGAGVRSVPLRRHRGPRASTRCGPRVRGLGVISASRR
ncbi:MAG: MerR family transcriptional regulator [Microbacterium sp.]|nr:MerR family transcriptional regulator [Microbacterium sp.]